MVATVPIGAGVDGTGSDAASGNAFASNADGTLTVIHQDTPDQYHLAESVQTPQRSRNMGLDPGLFPQIRSDLSWIVASHSR